MKFHARLTIAFVAIAALPLFVLGYGVQREMTAGLDADADRRVRSVESTLTSRLGESMTAGRARLQSLAADLASDNRFRAAVAGGGDDRRWLLDWAPAAMKIAGFAVLQVQDSSGRILSSGQFRNDFDRIALEIPHAVTSTPALAALVDSRTPSGTVRALVTSAAFTARGERFTITGGAGIDSASVAALSSDGGVAALLITGAASPPEGAMSVMTVPYVNDTTGTVPTTARIVLVADAAPVRALKAGVVRWLAITLGGVLVAAVLAALVLGGVISAPVTALAERATRAERAAALGDMARQVNHDIKNGLAPIRNVLRHLTQTAEREPGTLAAVYADRRGTLDAGVAYLDDLARNYAKLSPPVTHGFVEPAGVVRTVAGAMRSGNGYTLDLRVADSLPRVRMDALSLRRILDNLVSNAVDSLEGRPGTVSIAVDAVDRGARVRFVVSDTGRGMTRDELDHAFDDFHTTKPAGTGLGLSVVRRLLTDVGGSVRAETAPGKGSRFTIEIPSETAR